MSRNFSSEKTACIHRISTIFMMQSQPVAGTLEASSPMKVFIVLMPINQRINAVGIGLARVTRGIDWYGGRILKILDAALSYCRMGWSVVPILPGGKKPPKGITWVNRCFASADECHKEEWKKKHPKAKWGKADEAQIRKWWKQHPKANVGVLTGSISNIDVIDLDGPHALEALEAQGGITIPETVSSHTGRDDTGKHVVLKYHGGGLKNWTGFCTNGNGSKCDLRTDGGLFVAPPSVHKSGKRYQWIVDPEIEEPEPFPPELVGFIHKQCSKEGPTEKESVRTNFEDVFKEGIPDGEKHQGLFKFACKKISQGLSFDEVLCLTTELARKCNPLPKDGPEHAARVRVKEAFQKYGKDTEKANTVLEAVERLNEKHAVVMLSGKCTVLNQTIDPVFQRPDISFSSKADFFNFHSNQKISVPGVTKPVSVAEVWWNSPNRRQYAGIVNDPKEECGPEYFNLWRGFSVEPKKGNWGRVRDLIFESIADGHPPRTDYILSWMARIVQDPGGERPGVAIVMRGRQGVGKGEFARAFGSLFGNHFLQVAQANQVTGRFNLHMKDCLVLFVDEGFWAGDKQAEGVIKNLITEPTLTVEPKGKDLFQVKNNVNVLIASNSNWVVPAGLEERRFFVVDVGDHHRRDYAFFRKLNEQMDNGGREAMLYDLLNMDLSGVNLRDFERTEALLDQILESMTPIQSWWFGRLQEGKISSEHWPSEISNTVLYSDFERYCNRRKLYMPDARVFGRQFKKIVNATDIRKEFSDERERGKAFPALEDCREAFEKALDIEIEWETK